MDTVHIGLDETLVGEKILEQIRPNFIPSQFRGENGRFNRPFTYGYQHTFTGLIGSRHIGIATAPKSPKLKNSILVMHLDDFRTFGELTDWINANFGKWTDCILRSKVLRSDLCIDILCPFETVSLVVDQPNCTSHYRLRSRAGQRTIYFGEKPRVTCIYEKRRPVEMVDWIPDGFLMSDTMELVVRIEVRHWKSKIVARSLYEYQYLEHHDVFAHLKVRPLDPALLYAVSPPKIHILNSYLYRCEKVGVHEARKEFNRSNNFHKTVAPFVGKSELNLKKIWIDKCKRFNQ